MPLKQPIGTSKSSPSLILIQGVVPLKRSVFLACKMIDKLSSEILMNSFANSIHSLNELLEKDPQKFTTPQHIIDKVCLCVIFSNHVITEDVFFHWFTLVLDSMVELILSNNTLLIFPVLVFEGFSNLHDTWNPSLSSLIIINASFSCIFLTLP